MGLIGSKVKVRGILARLRDADRLDGVDLSRLHAPIGLDIGGSTHGEIAVSIVAELIAFRRGRTGGLKAMRLPIEEVVRVVSRRRAPDPEADSPGAATLPPARPCSGRISPIVRPKDRVPDSR